MNTLHTPDLEADYADNTGELLKLVSSIPDDTDGPDYLEAVEELAHWLGVHEADHIEFFGLQPWRNLSGHDLLESWGRSEIARRTYEIGELRDSIGIDKFQSGIILYPEKYKDRLALEIAEKTALENLSQWPYIHINWDSAAEDLRGEEVTYRGDRYFYPL